MLDAILETQGRLLASCNLDFKRYLYTDFKLNSRLIGLVGPRGVGKTTLLLQIIKEHYTNQDNVIYFSADFVYFRQKSLFDFARELVMHGYRVFFIDEIHQYANWEQELKNLYDSFPEIKIIFSGSSMLDLIKGSYDLSRRTKLYHLCGLSFREYLNFTKNYQIKPVSFDSLQNASRMKTDQLLTVDKILTYFDEYMRIGYYPFVQEDPDSIYERLDRVLDKIIVTIQQNLTKKLSKITKKSLTRFFGKNVLMIHTSKIIPKTTFKSPQLSCARL